MDKTKSQFNEYREYLWKALQVFTLYRLILSIVLLVLVETGLTPKTLGNLHPELYQWATLIYFISSLLVIPLVIKRKPSYRYSVGMLISIDVFCFVTLIHASGGVNNGLGVLMAVSIGISAILIGSYRAFAVPALATLSLFAEVFYANIHDLANFDFTQPALLSSSFFIISILSVTLAKRMQYTESIAIEREADLASMEAVSKNIIQTMTVGVLIIDDQQNIKLINDSAWKNLGMPTQPQDKPLKLVSAELHRQLKRWLRDSSISSIKFKADANAPELIPSFRKLDEGDIDMVIIFLEDTSLMTQQAQQLKLSSLGRLTASIAHEIRNPLGAISHAAQLLEESDKLADTEIHLTQMINKHSKRMNNIIENVMNLSQRRTPKLVSIELKPFLVKVIQELTSHRSQAVNVEIRIKPENCVVSFDKSQLQQVVNNLCDNALRYSMQESGQAKVTLVGGEEFGTAANFLDIIDYGPGITEQEQEHLFEPFYTTSKSGTGLGLYIARELCEANGAQLSYIPLPQEKGCCFRLNFARHRQLD